MSNLLEFCRLIMLVTSLKTVYPIRNNYSIAIFVIVCLLHVGLLYFVSYRMQTEYIQKHNTDTVMEVVSLPVKEEPVVVDLTQDDPPFESRVVPKKNEPKTQGEPKASKPGREFVAPNKAPQKQLAAKADEVLQDKQTPQLARYQDMQTTKTDNPSSGNFSSTSLSQGSGDKTVTKDGEKSGTAVQSTSPRTGKETSGGKGGKQNQALKLISINKNYPESLQRKGITGTVRVQVVVGANGRVKSATVVSSEHPELKEYGRRSAFSARFQPMIKEGEKTEATTIIPIKFEIKK